MPASWAEIVNSRTFKFIVGEDVDESPTEFSVHEEAIAQLSQALRALLTGELVEAKDGCTIWKEVSKQTFEQFSQFAYTGDYSVPEPEKVEKQAKKALEPVVEAPIPTPTQAEFIFGAPVAVETIDDDGWGGLGRTTSISKKKKGSKGKKSYMVFEEEAFVEPEAPIYEEQPVPKPRNTFATLSYELTAPRTNFLDSCEPPSNFLKQHSYSNILLSHAQLYTLADYRMVDSLKSLALFKLHTTLSIFQLDSDNLGDIVDLANFAYAEEGQGSEGGNDIGLLRDLVCHYIVDNTVALTADERFLELLDNGGEFAKDIWKYEVQRNH